MDYNEFFALATEAAKRLDIKISKTDLDKKICRVMAVTDPEAARVVAKSLNLPLRMLLRLSMFTV